MLTLLNKLFFLISLLALWSCNQEGLVINMDQSRIPSLPVSVQANCYNHSQLKELSLMGGYALIKQRFNEAPYIGYGGLLITRGYNHEHEAFTYDLACPYENKRTVLLEVIDNSLGVCPKCGSEFNGIFFGNPMPSKGPAYEKKYFLRMYPTTFSFPNIKVYH